MEILVVGKVVGMFILTLNANQAACLHTLVDGFHLH